MHRTRIGIHRAITLGWMGLVAAGCDSQPTAQVGDTPSTKIPVQEPNDARVRAPKPDTTRLAFDETTQVLSLYDLPENGACWMVALPAEPRGVPVQGDFRFSKPADPKTVSVFYTLPQGGMSNPVSLQEIVDAKKTAIH
jgi:hypothetical protein